MSRELEVAKEIVVSFWSSKLKETDSKEVINELFRVKHAKPEELVNDYEALIAILEKSIKRNKRQRMSNYDDQMIDLETREVWLDQGEGVLREMEEDLE